MGTTRKGSRKTGFRNFRGTQHQLKRARQLVKDHEDAFGPVLADLRLAVYCGPGSAGDRGEAVLSVTTRQGGRTGLHYIEREAEV